MRLDNFIPSEASVELELNFKAHKTVSSIRVASYELFGEG